MTGCLKYHEIFIPVRQTLFLETEVIWSQIRGRGWVLQKLLARHSVLWAGVLSWWRIQSVDQSSGLFLCSFT